MRSGIAFHVFHHATVNPCQRNDTFGEVWVAAAEFALKLYRIITRIGISRYAITSFV